MIQVLAPEGLLTTKQVATQAGCSVPTVHRWVERGHLTPVGKYPGKKGSLLFHEDDVAAAIKAGTA